MFKKNYLSKYLLTLLVNLFTFILTVIISITLARKLGANSYGIYIIVINLSYFIGQFFFQGLYQTLYRQLNKIYNIKLEKLKVVVFIFLFFILVLTLLLFLFHILINFSSIFNQSAWQFISYFYYLLPIVVSWIFLRAIINGLDKAYLVDLGEGLISKIFFLIFLIISFDYLTEELAIKTLIKVNSVTLIISFFITIFLIKSLFKYELIKNLKFKQSDLQNYINNIRKYTISSILTFGLLDLGTVVIGFLSSADQVSSLSIASRALFVVIMFQGVLNSTILPQLRGLNFLNDKFKIKKLINKIHIFFLILNFFVFLIVLFFGKIVIGILYGIEYIELVYPTAVVLFFSQFTLSTFLAFKPILDFFGYEKISINGLTLAFIFQLLLMFLLIPTYGALGFAISTLCSNSILSLFVFIKSRKII